MNLFKMKFTGEMKPTMPIIMECTTEGAFSAEGLLNLLTVMRTCQMHQIQTQFEENKEPKNDGGPGVMCLTCQEKSSWVEWKEGTLEESMNLGNFVCPKCSRVQNFKIPETLKSRL